MATTTDSGAAAVAATQSSDPTRPRSSRGTRDPRTVSCSTLPAVAPTKNTTMNSAPTTGPGATPRPATAPSPRAYVAYDDAVTGKRPGVLVCHEWWGNNAYSRGRAEQLARLGRHG